MTLPAPRLSCITKGAVPWCALPLIGQFNVLQHRGRCCRRATRRGCNLREAVRAMAQAPQIPGRMERVSPDNNRFHVFVDYAHTPDGFVNALSTCPRVCVLRRIITVFGCSVAIATASKRPAHGQGRGGQQRRRASSPATTLARKIRSASWKTRARASRRDSHVWLVERKKGHRYRACKDARDGDIIVIAGKGHEPLPGHPGREARLRRPQDRAPAPRSQYAHQG